MITDSQTDSFASSLAGSASLTCNEFDMALARLLEAINADSIEQLATALGVSRQAVYHAKTNKKIPPGWFVNIAGKYSLSLDWLVFGSGPKQRSADGPKQSESRQETAQNCPTEDFKMSDMLTKTAEVLESDTIYRTALASNINAFHQAVRNDRILAEMERRVAQLEEKIDAMSRRMEDLEKENQELKRRMEPPGQKQEVGAAG